MSWLGTADDVPADTPAERGRGDVTPALAGIPRQRKGRGPVASGTPGAPGPALVAGTTAAAGTPADAVDAAAPVASTRGAGADARRPSARWRPWRLLPTPVGTPFTFCYAALLAATSLFAEHADPSLVSELLRGSSTDVVHLSRTPLLVLVASALWIAGGLTSAFAVGFLVVLTALERRIGGLRTAAVFFGGHVLATLATEVPVALSVAAGHLPDSALHRLDYGISFGVMTCTGALAGLLPGWCRWPLLAGAGYLAATDLLAYTDPVSDWGHLLSLALGIASRPLLRRWRDRHTADVPLLGDLGHPALRGGRGQ